jgi:hypothetical protein
MSQSTETQNDIYKIFRAYDSALMAIPSVSIKHFDGDTLCFY